MKQVPVIIFGAGGVGSALLRQIVNGRTHTATRNQIRFDIVATVDSRSCLWNPSGLSDEQILAVVARKVDGELADKSGVSRPSDVEIVTRAAEAGLENGIVVDVTAVSGMEPVLDTALDRGYGLVLANKKAFAGSWSTAQKYFNNPYVRHESTVGGGQPVIATLRYLLDTNDPIFSIAGQLSGTLGFICAQLDTGKPFSQAIAEAKALGYTEPDPREDLGGQDVMRKVMILGRMAGWPLEAADINVESLYAPEMASLSVAEFMNTCNQVDVQIGQRVANAAANGEVLRYVAELTANGGTVGLKAVPQGSPLANLKYVSFHTERYADDKLMICGKGAGVEMTAAGVIGDMIDLVREEF